MMNSSSQKLFLLWDNYTPENGEEIYLLPSFQIIISLVSLVKSTTVQENSGKKWNQWNLEFLM